MLRAVRNDGLTRVVKVRTAADHDTYRLVLPTGTYTISAYPSTSGSKYERMKYLATPTFRPAAAYSAAHRGMSGRFSGVVGFVSGRLG